VPVPVNSVTIHVDGRPYTVRADHTLLRACLSLGFDLPYFCWHPAMESVGACRQCAVKQFRDEKDTKGRIVMSCMVQVEPGMRISIDDPEARKFRAANIEWLMLNHPHDCPVCDEGGECHLQDMTVMTGHTYRRTRFRKRTFLNQDLGPFVNHEMNRCIHCYRCVRFYRDYAGGSDFGIFSAHDHVYFGRHESGTLESPFSGNLVEVCPTGVFTDRTEKKTFIRKWDLQTAPSICVHCGLGCNTIPGERYGRLQRIRNRYNERVNGYFLCDRGRYGYDYVNSPNRIRHALIRNGGEKGHRKADSREALACLQDIMSESRGIVGIGSPRASLEENYALRTLVGPDRFFAGIRGKELDLIRKMMGIMKKGPAGVPSLADVQSCDMVFILGEDLIDTAPMMALNVNRALRNIPIAVAEKLGIPVWNERAIREEIQHRNGPLFIAAPVATTLDENAVEVFTAAPDEVARLGFAVANLLDSGAPRVEELSEQASSCARIIADTLKMARDPLIVSGASSGNERIVEAASNVARALSRTGARAKLSFVFPECNSLGLGLMCDQGLDAALEDVESGRADTLVILGNDLFRRENSGRIRKCLERCRKIVLLDQIFHATAEYAHLVLPAATFAEQSGTLVNNEGRGQRFFQVFAPAEDIRPARTWVCSYLNGVGFSSSDSLQSLDAAIRSLSEAFPDFRDLGKIAPSSGFRIDGMKIPRESHRVSGRTSMHADRTMHEPQPPDDPDSPLDFSMEGYDGEPPSSLIQRYWSPGWNSVQALNKFQAEVGGGLHGGPSGFRLIEPEASGGDYFHDIPGPFLPPSPPQLLAVPLHHVFGSEELSRLSPAIASRIPAARVLLNPLDAERLGIGEGDEAVVMIPGAAIRLPVEVAARLRRGVAGIPAGFSELTDFLLNGRVEIRRAVT